MAKPVEFTRGILSRRRADDPEEGIPLPCPGFRTLCETRDPERPRAVGACDHRRWSGESGGGDRNLKTRQARAGVSSRLFIFAGNGPIYGTCEWFCDAKSM